MNNRTKKNLFIAITVLFLCAIISVFIIYQIKSEGGELEKSVSLLKEHKAKESSFTKINSLVMETADDRSQIDSHFFSDEGDTIELLNNFETLAKANNINLSIDSLEKVMAADKKTEMIKINFSYEGTKQLVIYFTKLLETLPYHSRIENLSLRTLYNNLWSANITMYITIQPPV